MDNDEFKPEDISNAFETVKGDIDSGIQDAADAVSESLGNAVESVKENADAAVNDFAEKAEETFENISEKAADIEDEIKTGAEESFEDAADKLKDFSESTEEKLENSIEELREIPEEAEKILDEAGDSVREAADEIREDFAEVQENLADTADEIGDAVFSEGEEITEAAETKAVDHIQAVHYEAEEKAEDILQDFREVRSHQPSIPQYVPKTYVRETPEEPETRGVRGSMGGGDYDGYPTVDDVQPAPRGSLNSTGSGKSSNTALWIILAVVLALLVGCCCMVQAVFAVLRFLAG